MEKRGGNNRPESQQSFRSRVAESQGTRMGVLYERLDKEMRKPRVIRFFRRPVINNIQKELSQEQATADSFNFGS
jgi:hypothetical protein